MVDRSDRSDKSSKSSKSSKKHVSSKPFFTLVAFSFAIIIGLGFFRFNSSHLEYRLSILEKSIERYSTEEEELMQTLSSLTSPIKIYGYCKDQLGMTASKQETLHVQSVRVANASQAEPQKGWRSSMFAFFGFAVN